jgi:hypothetical protein
MKTITIISLIAMGLLATTGIVATKALYNKAKTTVFIPYRDTVYIDRGRSDCQPWYQYQIELGNDSTHIWRGQELVSIVPANSNVDSIIRMHASY